MAENVQADEELAAALLVYATLREHLDCPVCTGIMEAPIYMCERGHNICSSCQQQPLLISCPICRTPDKPACRNMCLELLAELIFRPCDNQHRGCQVFSNAEHLRSHRPLCDFGHACLLNDGYRCLWVGNRQGLYDHVPTHTPCNLVAYDFIFQMKENQSYTNLYEVEGEFFWLENLFLMDKSTLQFYARYIGPEENASNFHVSWSFSSSDRSAGAISCTTEVLSLNEKFDDAHVKKHVALISKKYTSVLNGKVAISYTINIEQTTHDL